VRPLRAYVRAVYDGIHADPASENGWDRHTSRQISDALEGLRAELDTKTTVNIGSGGLSYGLENPIEVDLVLAALRDARRAIVGDAHRLPIRTDSAKAVICVGGVVNYLSLSDAIAEIARVVQRMGMVVIEYERTSTLQFVGTATFRKHVSPQLTTYRGEQHVLWRYSDAYVLGTMESHGFKVAKVVPFHLLSPLLLRLGAPSIVVDVIARLDPLLRYFGFLNRFAANQVIVARYSALDSRLMKRSRRRGAPRTFLIQPESAAGRR
jgi:hypothetical protein